MYGECLFKKVECLSSKQGKITKQDKAKVVFELRLEFPVGALLELADIKRSTYYYWIKTFDRPDKDAELKTLIQSIYHEHKGRYGYRRITDELKNQGHTINHKKVQRLMKVLGLKCIVRMKKYRSYKGGVGKPKRLPKNKMSNFLGSLHVMASFAFYLLFLKEIENW